MKKCLKATLTLKFILIMGIIFLFSCETKKSESSLNSSDTSSGVLQEEGELPPTSINFFEYTISKSYLDALPASFKLIIFQAEILGGEFKLNAYYSKPGTAGPQKEYVRIPAGELVKGKAITLNFPFSIGNNQILRTKLMGTPPHRYVSLQIIPFIQDEILKFELNGIGESLDKISLGSTNPSPPDTSLE